MLSRLVTILILVLSPLAGVRAWSSPVAPCDPQAALATLPVCCCTPAMAGPGSPDACPCVAQSPTEAPEPEPAPAPTPQRGVEVVTIAAPASPVVVVASTPRPRCVREGQSWAAPGRDRSAARASTGVWRT